MFHNWGQIHVPAGERVVSMCQWQGVIFVITDFGTVFKFVPELL